MKIAVIIGMTVLVASVACASVPGNAGRSVASAAYGVNCGEDENPYEYIDLDSRNEKILKDICSLEREKNELVAQINAKIMTLQPRLFYEVTIMSSGVGDLTLENEQIARTVIAATDPDATVENDDGILVFTTTGARLNSLSTEFDAKLGDLVRLRYIVEGLGFKKKFH